MNTQNYQNQQQDSSQSLSQVQGDQDNPYVEDKALTWQSMSRSGRAAVSAGIVAVGASVLFGPAMPVMAQIFGVSQSLPGLADEADAATIPGGVPQGNRVGIANPAGSADSASLTAASLGTSVVTGAGTVSSISSASTMVSNSPNTVGNQVQPKLQLPQTNLNFGNTSSATPSAGGSGSSGKNSQGGWSGQKGEHGDDEEHGDRGEYEGNDD